MVAAPPASDKPDASAGTPRFAVGDRVVANRDITGYMLHDDPDMETVVVPKDATGTIDGLSSDFMRGFGFDFEVSFDKYSGWYVKADWLSPPSSRPPWSSALSAHSKRLRSRNVTDSRRPATKT